MEDLRRYLGHYDRAQDQYANGSAEWVDATYRKLEALLEARLSDDGRWIEASSPLPVRTANYDAQVVRYELLRRRFVIAGWVSAAIQVSPQLGQNATLLLRAPRETVIVQTTEGQAILPELTGSETAREAVARIITSGASFYRSPWEQVTIPPHQIARIVRSTPTEPLTDERTWQS